MPSGGPVDDLAAVREALLRDLRGVALASPVQQERLRARVRELPPGAWTAELKRRVGSHWGALPEGAVGVAAFPAVRADGGRCEVRVDVVRCVGADRVDGVDPGTEAAVRDALAAARARADHTDGFEVRFAPRDGWRGESCGLAVALAAVSAGIDQPLRHGVWATGRVRPDGRIEAIGSLDRKRAGDGRTLLAPRANGPDLHAVGTLAEAQACAIGAVLPAAVAAVARASVSAWMRGLGWSAEMHAHTTADAALATLEPVQAGGPIAVLGLGGTGASWRLAAWVAKAGERVLTLVVDGFGAQDEEVLTHRAATAVGWDGPERAPTLAAVMTHLRDAARALGRPALLVVDDASGPVAGALAAAARGVDGLRVAWSGRADAWGPEGTQVVWCPSVLGDAAWGHLHLHGLPPSARTARNDAVLGTVLGLCVSRSMPEILREGAPILPVTLLRALLAQEAERLGAARFAALQAFLLAQAPNRPRMLRRVPAHLRATVLSALESNLLACDAQGRLLVRDTLVWRALAVSPCEARAARWVRVSMDGLLAPGPWLACRRRAVGQASVVAKAREDGSEALEREWLDGGVLDDLLVASMTQEVSEAAWGRWAASAQRAIAAVDPADEDAGVAVAALGSCLARAVLLSPGVSAACVARVVARLADPSRGQAERVVAGVVSACAYDTWPVLAATPGEVAGLVRALDDTLAGAARAAAAPLLEPLRTLAGWDARALVARVEAHALEGQVELPAPWLPVVHLMLFPLAWPLPEGAPAVQHARDAVAECWWARARAVAAAGGEDAEDAAEEAEQVAWAMWVDATTRGDAGAEAHWRTRAPSQEPLGGGVAEGDAPLRPMNAPEDGTLLRDVARTVFVLDVTCGTRAG